MIGCACVPLLLFGDGKRFVVGLDAARTFAGWYCFWVVYAERILLFDCCGRLLFATCVRCTAPCFAYAGPLFTG